MLTYILSTILSTPTQASPKNAKGEYTSFVDWMFDLLGNKS